MILLRANRLEAAHKLADRVTPRSGFAGLANYIIAKSGDTATARQRLRELDAKTPQPWMAETDRAWAYLGLGDTARALSAMERATDGKEIWYVSNGLFDPIYDSVRESARFKKLLAQVGLTP